MGQNDVSCSEIVLTKEVLHKKARIWLVGNVIDRTIGKEAKVARSSP